MADLALFNFLDPSSYSGSVFIPEGDYCCFFDIMNYQATDKQTGVARGKSNLGVMISFYPLLNPAEGSKLEKFYGMGQKADEIFAPHPETGKSLVIKPDAKGQPSLNDKTNWYLFFNSLLQSGMPKGIASNDISVLDGVWVHIVNEDEPLERASFKSNTAEVQEERKIGKVAVVSEILEGGAPWEGGGQLPEAPVAAAPRAVAAPAARPAAARPPAARPVNGAATPPAVAAPAAPRTVARPAAVRPTARPAPVTAAPAVDAGSAEDLRGWALDAVGEVLADNLNGLNTGVMRTKAFEKAEAKFGQDVAGQIISAYFEAGGAGSLPDLLNEMGYKVVGPMIKQR